MSVFKCKMCGGALNVDTATVCECEFCGTKQTLPKLADDKRANLYDRANHFRRANEYDKAMAIYEQILSEDTTDAESYWSLVLCRYGIEYVEDPLTHKRIPTVNRAQFTSIYDDEDYKSALNYADAAQKGIYEDEARSINEIQKGILQISSQEEPFDIFICYKETDSAGRRTKDSVLAQDLYFGLKNEGFKVFFARITLEDKLGSAYEPYIFAALNSSKVMVVLGTCKEHFDAVWVKNEWSRYLSLIKKGEKKVLIPAYKDMDPYDLPEEFSHLQAQDMSKLGFMQDLIRGIKKIAKTEDTKTEVKETVVIGAQAASTAPLLKRAHIFLDDSDFDSAKEYAEKCLDIDPECAEAYVLEMLCEYKIKSEDALLDCQADFTDSISFKRAVRFGDASTREKLISYANQRNYNTAKKLIDKIDDDYAYETAAVCLSHCNGYLDADELLSNLPNYRDSFLIDKANAIIHPKKFDGPIYHAKGYIEKISSPQKRSEMMRELEAQNKAYLYFLANKKFNEKDFEGAEKLFTSLGGYMDSAQRARSCRSKESIDSKLEWLKKNKLKVGLVAGLAIAWLIILIAIM